MIAAAIFSTPALALFKIVAAKSTAAVLVSKAAFLLVAAGTIAFYALVGYVAIFMAIEGGR